MTNFWLTEEDENAIKYENMEIFIAENGELYFEIQEKITELVEDRWKHGVPEVFLDTTVTHESCERLAKLVDFQVDTMMTVDKDDQEKYTTTQIVDPFDHTSSFDIN